jgi:hypothetical protein
MSRTFRVVAALVLLLALTATLPASAKRAADADLSVATAGAVGAGDSWWSGFVAFGSWFTSLFQGEHGGIVPKP